MREIVKHEIRSFPNISLPSFLFLTKQIYLISTSKMWHFVAHKRLYLSMVPKLFPV